MAQPSDDGEWMTIEEVARHLRMAPTTLSKLVAAGDFPAVRVGPRFWRIHRDTIAALKKAATEKAAS